MKVSIQEAARIMGGTLVGEPSGKATGASIHSTKLRPGDLFFAFPGHSMDGHDFVQDAFFNGASAAVVSRQVPDAAGPQILVADPGRALASLAGWVRDTVDPVVVGITGSSGKTSVKDLLASIASGSMKTVAARGSFNNDLGVPLTLLEIKPETEVVICEMGARGRGHIRRLCEYARPHVGVVTNVGVTHFEQFGSKGEIAAAKKELIDSLPEGAAAVLNADDPVVAEMGIDCAADVTTFGLGGQADVRAADVAFNRLGQASFQMISGKASAAVSLPVAGIHQVSNALAASAAGLCLGLTLDDCRKGLESAKLSRWRMQVNVHSGVVFVNDAYNANPDSVTSALHSCAKMAEGGRLIAVLGFMAELGDISDLEHRRIGRLAARLASKLIVAGQAAGPIAEGAREAGMTDVQMVSDGPGVVPALGPLRPGDVVLVKGSRVAGLEDVPRLAMSQGDDKPPAGRAG